MLLREAEATVLAAAVFGGGSMKLSGVASWPAAGGKLGATAPSQVAVSVFGHAVKST